MFLGRVCCGPWGGACVGCARELPKNTGRTPLPSSPVSSCGGGAVCPRNNSGDRGRPYATMEDLASGGEGALLRNRVGSTLPFCRVVARVF